MSIYGIPKPAYRAFEILHRLGDRMHPVQGTHETVSAWMVSGADRSTVVIVTSTSASIRSPALALPTRRTSVA